MENITFTKELIINLFDFGYVLIFTLLSIILFAVSKNEDTFFPAVYVDVGRNYQCNWCHNFSFAGKAL